MAVVLCFKMRKNSRVLCCFQGKTNTLCAVLTVIYPMNITGKPKENTRSGAPLERGRTVYFENVCMDSMNMDGCQKSKDPNPHHPKHKNPQGFISTRPQSDPFPVPSALPGGWQKQGRSFTSVYDRGARGGLPETRVGFSPGALLMRYVPTLWVHAGKTVEIGWLFNCNGQWPYMRYNGNYQQSNPTKKYLVACYGQRTQ